MRTTVRIDGRLLAEAKKYAAEHGRTLTDVIEDALKDVLARHGPASGTKSVASKTVGGTGLQPSLATDDSVPLLDIIEQGE